MGGGIHPGARWGLGEGCLWRCTWGTLRVPAGGSARWTWTGRRASHLWEKENKESSSKLFFERETARHPKVMSVPRSYQELSALVQYLLKPLLQICNPVWKHVLEHREKKTILLLTVRSLVQTYTPCGLSRTSTRVLHWCFAAKKLKAAWEAQNFLFHT